jgi:hypothetical protein
MTMTGLIEDYLREVEASLRIEPHRRAQVVDELRSHLREKVAERQGEDPLRPLEDVEREVLNEMGSPRDLAFAYEPDGAPVLVNRSGDTVLQVGKAVGRGASTAVRAVGRGTRRALKGLAVALAVLLALAVVGGAWAYYELKPYALAAAEDSRPVYAFYQYCGEGPCDALDERNAFHVKPEARDVRFAFSFSPASFEGNWTASGDLSVTFLDPEGHVVYARNLSLSAAQSFNQEIRWAAAPGNWTVSIRAADLVGQVEVRAYVTTTTPGLAAVFADW